MKPTAYIINTSRGPIIDEAALLAALRDKKIGGAGLDVFDVEPLPVDHPLRSMDNVVLTPHLGYVAIAELSRLFRRRGRRHPRLHRRQARARDGLTSHRASWRAIDPSVMAERVVSAGHRAARGGRPSGAIEEAGGAAPGEAADHTAPAAAVAGGLPGSTTTRVPTLTRV